jgi:hypothetical protein
MENIPLVSNFISHLNNPHPLSTKPLGLFTLPITSNPNRCPSNPRNHTSNSLPLELFYFPLPSTPRRLLTHNYNITNSNPCSLS